MRPDSFGNVVQPANTIAEPDRVLGPAGVQVYVGGFPVILRYDTVFDVSPVYAPLIRAEIEGQIRKSER